MSTKYTEPVAQLLAYGDPREETQWPNYLSLGFTEEHVPELVEMALDDELNRGSGKTLKIWAPVHAWRTLAQLQAEDAIEPLLALFDFEEAFDDDWALSELPTIYGMIGQKAIPVLSKHLSDNPAEDMPGIVVVDCIREIGKTHPQAQLECIEVLSSQLERFNYNSLTVNGFLISGLVELRALDRLPLIKQAFDSGRVDLSIVGDMEDVEIDWGLREGRSTPRPGLFEEGGGEFSLIFESDGSNPKPQKPKIGRNDPCPCGSGRKYKKCCFNK